MAIEIRELIIKTTVSDGDVRDVRGKKMHEKESAVLKKEIIEECIHRIIEQLRKEKER